MAGKVTQPTTGATKERITSRFLIPIKISEKFVQGSGEGVIREETRRHVGDQKKTMIRHGTQKKSTAQDKIVRTLEPVEVRDTDEEKTMTTVETSVASPIYRTLDSGHAFQKL